MDNKKYTFFWGGSYSNWYMSDFTIDGLTFCCNEQYMMYMKAMTFNDKDTANRILAVRDPKSHKALGRQVKGFDNTKWDEVKEDIVYTGLKAKYTQNKTLLNRIINDKSELYVEASPFDKVWGIGLSELDARKIPESEWKGQNLLGKLLTKLKLELQNTNK